MALRFIPWVKSGTGAAVAVPETLSEALASRISLPVTLRINDRHDVSIGVGLFGPGDITGIDRRQVIREEPRHLSSDFEPNYFPAVTFWRPDFPWMFTPATGDPRGRLRPWLCLVVVRVQEGVRFAVRPNAPLPVLTIGPPAQPSSELPDLADSWAWAHAQVLGPHQEAALKTLLAGESADAISRLLCPVKLVPRQRYHACLVPAFEAGRKAGLGLAAGPGDDTLAPAWRSGPAAPATIELPVYFQWEFGTGAGGDFESLVSRLRGTTIASGVGRRDMTVSGLGFGLPDLDTIAFEGALRAVNPAPPAPDAQKLPQFQEALRAILDQTGPTPDAEPIVRPPLYGSYHAAVQQTPAPDTGPVWLRDLNLDPRHRAAAGLGTLVIQDQQELLMVSAWEQLAGVKSALQAIRQAELAREVGRKILAKHFAPLSGPQLLELTVPVHARVRFTSEARVSAGARLSSDRLDAVPTLDAELQEGRLPRGVTTGAFRTTFRSGGPVSRRVAAVSTTPSAKSVTERLVDRVVQPVSSVPIPPVHGVVTIAQIRAQLDGLRTNLGPSPPDSAAKRFLDAADLLRPHLEPVSSSSLAPQQPTPPALTEVKRVLLARLDPDETVTTRVQARLSLPASRASAAARSEAADEPAILPPPEFPQPMYEALRDFSQEFLLPGAENVPADSVSLVETNTRFVESFMVGLNHEMSRELLWREYPADQRGTYFTRFWDVAGSANPDSLKQIPSVHEWDPKVPLGGNFMAHSAQSGLVLLIRGEVLRRYPGTVIYAVRVDTLDQEKPDELYPIFRGTLDPDIVFLGFNLTEARARGDGGQPGYYFVIQEQPAEPRFGLDVPGEFGGDLSAWSHLTWGHVVADAEALDRLTHLPLAGPLNGRRLEEVEWAFNSAHMARITLQKRMRVVIHANELLPPRR